MNRRDLSMDKYGISKHMYRELYNFCLQYAEKKTRINSGRWGGRRGFTESPPGPGVSDPTYIAVNASERAREDVEDIERTVRTVVDGGEAYKALLLNVTAGVPYERLVSPMGRNQFFIARRKFFYELARVRGML